MGYLNNAKTTLINMEEEKQKHAKKFSLVKKIKLCGSPFVGRASLFKS